LDEEAKGKTVYEWIVYIQIMSIYYSFILYFNFFENGYIQEDSVMF